MKHLLVRFLEKDIDPRTSGYFYKYLVRYDYKTSMFMSSDTYLYIMEKNHPMLAHGGCLYEVHYNQVVNNFEKYFGRSDNDKDLYVAHSNYGDEGDFGYWQGYTKHESLEEKRKRLLAEDKCPVCEKPLRWISLALCCDEHGVQV